MSLDKVIRLDTGDFSGKPPSRDGEGPTPANGDAVRRGHGRARVRRGGHEGREPAGTLTSPCESPTLGKVIGMAVLETRFATRARR